MKLLLCLALATQSIVWHAHQWRAELEPFYRTGRQYSRYPAGSWQHISGPAAWLIPRLDYDPTMHLWFLWQGAPGTAAIARVPLHENDVLTLEANGYIRVGDL